MVPPEMFAFVTLSNNVRPPSVHARRSEASQNTTPGAARSRMHNRQVEPRENAVNRPARQVSCRGRLVRSGGWWCYHAVGCHGFNRQAEWCWPSTRQVGQLPSSGRLSYAAEWLVTVHHTVRIIVAPVSEGATFTMGENHVAMFGVVNGIE